MERSDIRRQAYAYIREKLAVLPVDSGSPELFVPLDDLGKLRDGLTDPSVELVASLRQLLGHAIGEIEFHSHLVAPFEGRERER